MAKDYPPELPDDALPPLPPGIRWRRRKFSQQPITPPTNISRDEKVPFEIQWEDSELKLKVTMCKDRNRLSCLVEHPDRTLYKKAAVSVALVGTVEDMMIRKTIPLDQDNLEKGCWGNMDFGSVNDVIDELGLELRLVIFMLFDK